MKKLPLNLAAIKSSVWRDIHRCKKNKYSAITATCHAVIGSLKRRYGKCKIVHNAKLGKYVLVNLGLHWSPEQIHLHLKKKYPNTKSMNISMVFKSRFMQCWWADFIYTCS